MKKHINKIYCVFLIVVFASALLITAYAHPGKTDSNGGHYDRSTGKYHYHHGYSAHQHTNSECPYDSNYNKKNNSDTSNSTTTDNNNNNSNNSNKKSGLIFGLFEKENIYPWILTALGLSVFPIYCAYYDIKQKKQDNAMYKKKIFDYYGETIRVGPFSKKNKELAVRCKQIDDEIIKNKKQIALLNIENVDLPFLFRYMPKDIQINQNFKIEYLEASKELPFGKYTAFYTSYKTLHFKNGCYSATAATSTLELPRYFDPNPNICSRCCPPNFKKDHPELFSPQWYTRYTQITKKMQDFDIQLADLTFSKIDKKSKTYGQLMDDRLDTIFKEHFNSDDIDSYIDSEMREYLDKKYSLLKRLKKDGIYSFIHDMPDFIEITSDFLLKSKKQDNTFGKYTVYLSNKTIHRTVHFNEKYTRTASYNYYMFNRPGIYCLCEECWSNIPPNEREKLINPNWHKEYLAIGSKIKEYNLYFYKILNKDEDTAKKSPEIKYCIQLWSAAKNQWLRKNHYIE